MVLSCFVDIYVSPYFKKGTRMNANELADAMLTIEKPHPTWTKAATMLRQQQAEISLLQEYVCQLESGLDSSIKLNKAQVERELGK
jgi:hypothetical protein